MIWLVVLYMHVLDCGFVCGFVGLGVVTCAVFVCVFELLVLLVVV